MFLIYHLGWELLTCNLENDLLCPLLWLVVKPKNNSSHLGKQK